MEPDSIALDEALSRALSDEFDRWVDLVREQGLATAGPVMAQRLDQLQRSELNYLVFLAATTLGEVQQTLADIGPEMLALVDRLMTERGDA